MIEYPKIKSDRKLLYGIIYIYIYIYIQKEWYSIILIKFATFITLTK